VSAKSRRRWWLFKSASGGLGSIPPKQKTAHQRWTVSAHFTIKT
jgi:hypothetical protein